MSEISNETVCKVCAVWLFLVKADDTRIKFWSQLLRCTENQMNYAIGCVKHISDPKFGIKNNDAFLRVVYTELKSLPHDSIKEVFNGIRKDGKLNIVIEK